MGSNGARPASAKRLPGHDMVYGPGYMIQVYLDII